MENQPAHPFDMGKHARMAGIVFAALIVIFVLILPSFYTVRSGQRAIMFTWGKITSISEEGLHFKVPIMQTVTYVDVRTQKATAPAEAASRNMQTVNTSISLNYHLDPSKLAQLYSTVGLDVSDKIVAARIQETVKAVVAKYTAEELLSKREQIRDEITAALTKSLGDYNIIVDAGGVQITNFDFSKEFNQAIENKQVAEQAALTAKNKLEQTKIEAEQKIAQAQGEAEAIKIQAAAIQAQGGPQYVMLQAVNKWNGTLPQYMGGNAPLPFLQVQGK